MVALAGGGLVATALAPERASAHHICGHLYTTGSCPHPYLTVSKGSGSRIALAMPFGRIEFGATRTFSRWSVVTMFTGDTCRRTCIDHVPDAGR